MNLVRRSRLTCTFATSGLLLFSGIAMLPLTTRTFAQAPDAEITSADYKEYEAANELAKAGKFKEAIKAYEAFLVKWTDKSPQSRWVELSLGIAMIQEGLFDEAAAIFKKAGNNKNLPPDVQQSAFSYVPKAMALKASKLPATNDAQKEIQKKAFDEAIKEYDTFINNFKTSKELDSMQFTRASLLAAVGRYDEAIKGLAPLIVAQKAASPTYWDARLLLARVHMSKVASLLDNKDRSPDDVKTILAAFEEAQQHLIDVYAHARNADLALANNAVFDFANIQITRANLASTPEEKTKLLNQALDGFRGVRTTEEVVQAQEAKVAKLQDDQKLINQTREPVRWEAYEKAIQREREKLDEFRAQKDQSLQARLSIVNIFLQLKKPDEARTLLKYATVLGEVEKDIDAQRSIAASLTLTYIEQKNAVEAEKAYQAFRDKHRATSEGEALPLGMANMYLGLNQPSKVAEYVDEGLSDYPGWKYTSEGNTVRAIAFSQDGDFNKAIESMQGALAKLEKSPNQDSYASTLYSMATILQKKASTKKDPKAADEALAVYETIRQKFPGTVHDEKAHFSMCNMLAGKDPAKAAKELKSYIDKYTTATPFLETKDDRPKNIPVAWHLMATAQSQTSAKDEAIKTWQTLVEKYPDSLPAPGAFFKQNDIYKERQNWEASVNTMEEFIKKYPKHENLYFAYSNIAEVLMTKGDAAGLDAGSKKLMELVEYEKANEVDKKRGDTALLRIAERWLSQNSKLPPYVTLSEDQKAAWKMGSEGAIAAVERLIAQYPKSGLVPEGLDKLVSAQKSRTTAGAIDAKTGEKYFTDLSGSVEDAALKAKINVALAAYLAEADPKRAFDILDKSIGNPPPPMMVPVDPTKPEAQQVAVPTFSPKDYDSYLQGLFDAKRFPDMDAVIIRLRDEYPVTEGVAKVSKSVQDGQATGLFWEAKLLLAQGKTAEAGAKFEELKKKYSSSTKVMEADYGIILGKVDKGEYEPDMLKRLSIIVNGRHTNFELPAKALLLIARIQEHNGDIDSAIDSFIKINARYASAPEVAAEGLWRGAQLLERQVRGELKILTPKQRKALAQDKENEAVSKAGANPEEEEKPEEEKPADPTAPTK